MLVRLPSGSQPKACSVTVGSIHPKGHPAPHPRLRRPPPPNLGRLRAQSSPGGSRGAVPRVIVSSSSIA